MKVLIIGGSGKTGRKLIRQGLEQGHTITALVRRMSSIKTVHPNLHLLEGNVLNPRQVDLAITGQEAVLCSLGHKRFFIKTSILSKGTRNLISSMEKEGIKRLICITSLGINDSRYRLGLYYTLFTIPFILFFYFRDKEKQEKLIRASRLDWTIVRPGQLTNGKKREKYRHGSGLGHYMFTRMVSRADLAHFMLGELKRPKYQREVVGITY